MSISEFYESSEHKSNFSHFAAIVSLAAADGTINSKEEKVLRSLAFKLYVSEEVSKAILKEPNSYPLIPPYSLEKRVERIHDLFSIIYTDYEINDDEQKLIMKYAIGLGFSEEKARDEIQKYTRIFSGKYEFED